jgi:hypothetical protein
MQFSQKVEERSAPDRRSSVDYVGLTAMPLVAATTLAPST